MAGTVREAEGEMISVWVAILCKIYRMSSQVINLAG